VTPETAAAAEGAQIGHCIDERYRLEAVIGVGGLGSVYRATHTKLQRQVAVKLMHESLGESPVQRGRFAREAKALAALQHPNIVAVLDYGVAQTQPYLVMELLEGETLSQRLQRGPLPVERALHIAQQLLEALSFMHRARLLHRDVKPSNVFLQRMRDGQERVKVLDFGLAKFTTPAVSGGDPTLTRDGAIVGTPAYMSPEQATGEIVDARSDVYASGVILFRMLSGRLPFEGDAIDQVRSHLIAPVPDLRRDAEPDHELDPALEALIRRAMAKRREDRFDDAGQMLRALAEAFPQHVHAVLPQHEVVLPDPFAVDALNAAWLLDSDHDSEIDTLPRAPRGPSDLTGISVRRVGRAIRTLIVTSVRLFAGMSVLIVVGSGAIFVLLLRNDADRAELSALRRRVSDRLIEHSSSAGAPAEEQQQRKLGLASGQLARKPLDIHTPQEPSQQPTAAASSRVPAETPSPALAIAEPKPDASRPQSADALARKEKPKTELAAEAAPVAALHPSADPPISRSFAAAPPGMLPGSAPAPQPSAATPPGVLPASGSAAAAAYTMPPRSTTPPASRLVDAAEVMGGAVTPAPAARVLPAPVIPPPSAASAVHSSAGAAASPLIKVSGIAGALGGFAAAERAKLPDPNPPVPENTSRFADALAFAGAAGSASATLPPALLEPADPWLQPLPEKLRRARKTTLSGGRGSDAMIDALREYNREHQDDPRGHLLLAQLYLNRFWRADALSQFSIALTLDPSARAAPEVLSGLLVLVIHGTFAREAERVVINRYGNEAVPQIDQALNGVREKDPQVTARLEALRTRAAMQPRH
jgi:serine/threonine protein kinase